MKTSIGLLVLVLSMILVLGCAPREKVNVTSSRAALPENCPITLYGVNDKRPANYETLATIKLGEKGLSVSCSRNEVEAEMRTQACKAGANAIIVLKEKGPDVWSTCYRVTAELVYAEGS